MCAGEVSCVFVAHHPGRLPLPGTAAAENSAVCFLVWVAVISGHSNLCLFPCRFPKALSLHLRCQDVVVWLLRQAFLQHTKGSRVSRCDNAERGVFGDVLTSAFLFLSSSIIHQAKSRLNFMFSPQMNVSYWPRLCLLILSQCNCKIDFTINIPYFNCDTNNL